MVSYNQRSMKLQMLTTDLQEKTIKPCSNLQLKTVLKLYFHCHITSNPHFSLVTDLCSLHTKTWINDGKIKWVLFKKRAVNLHFVCSFVFWLPLELFPLLSCSLPSAVSRASRRKGNSPSPVICCSSQLLKIH